MLWLDWMSIKLLLCSVFPHWGRRVRHLLLRHRFPRNSTCRHVRGLAHIRRVSRVKTAVRCWPVLVRCLSYFLYLLTCLVRFVVMSPWPLASDEEVSIRYEDHLENLDWVFTRTNYTYHCINQMQYFLIVCTSTRNSLQLIDNIQEDLNGSSANFDFLSTGSHSSGVGISLLMALNRSDSVKVDHTASNDSITWLLQHTMSCLFVLRVSSTWSLSAERYSNLSLTSSCRAFSSEPSSAMARLARALWTSWTSKCGTSNSSVPKSS